MEYRLLGGSGLEVSVLSFGTMTLGGEGRFAAMGNVQVEEARRLIEICYRSRRQPVRYGRHLLGRQVGGSGRPGPGRAPQRHRPGHQVSSFALEPGTNKAGLSRAPHPGSLRGESPPSGNRLHRSLPGPQLRLPHAAGRNPARLRRSDPRRQDPLRRLLQLRRLATHEGPVHLGPPRHSRAISRSRSTIRCSPATPNTNWCPVASTSGRASWPGAPCNSACCPANSAAARRSPSESRLNTLDAPGTIDEERLYRIVDALAEIAAQRGVSISQVALNWVTRKPRVDTVIIGARNEQQLRDNLAAATWTLTDAEVERLDEVSALPLPYPYWHQQKFAGDRNPPAKHVR